MATERPYHFGHLLQVSKTSLQPLILNTFFMILFMYIAPGQLSRQPLGDKILMATERPYHFGHLLQVSKTSLQPLILNTFFHDFIHVYSPWAT